MIVLIDDDKMIRASWAMKAKSKGILLETFDSLDAFWQAGIMLSNVQTIYIDSDLKANLPGEILAKQIFEKGFNEIYIATSFTDIDLSLYPWVKGIISKRPPF